MVVVVGSCWWLLVVVVVVVSGCCWWLLLLVVMVVVVGGGGWWLLLVVAVVVRGCSCWLLLLVVVAVVDRGCSWWLLLLLLASRPSNNLVYLRDGSAQKILRADTLRRELQIQLSTSPCLRSADTGPTSPSADPTTPGAWQGSHRSANFEVTGMTRTLETPPPPPPPHGASEIRIPDLPLWRRTP